MNKIFKEETLPNGEKKTYIELPKPNIGQTVTLVVDRGKGKEINNEKDS